jgi:TolB-like protein/Tfp pilus assembly protein PilF
MIPETAKELLIDLRNLKQPLPAGSKRRTGTLVIVGVILIAVTMFAALFLVRRDQPITSLAVLPFTNVSGDSNTEYLSDGISDSIISSLSQVSNLKVISLTSVLRYKGQQVDPRTIGQELNVRAVLTGTLIQRPDGLSISTELIDIRDNSRIWGEQYNRKVADILQLQSEIAQEISGKLRLRLSGDDQQQLAKSHTTNSEAYQLYLQGRFYWNKYTKAGFRKSIEYYNLAIEKDPNYALAHAGIADSYVQLGIDFLVEDAVPRARTHATRALDLDDTLAEAHMSLGEVKLFYDWDWPSAEREFKRAIELKPNYPDTYHFYGHYLETIGRFDDAIAVTKRALELDPNSLIINSELAWAYFFARQTSESEKQALKTLDLDPRFGVARQYLGRAYAQERRYDEAIAALKQARVDVDDFPGVMMDLGCVYAAAGNRTEALKIIHELEDRISKGIDPYLIAPIHALLGDRDQAFAWIEKAYAKRSFWLPFLKSEPRLESLRSDPRFADLVRRVGIPQ